VRVFVEKAVAGNPDAYAAGAGAGGFAITLLPVLLRGLKVADTDPGQVAAMMASKPTPPAEPAAPPVQLDHETTRPRMASRLRHIDPHAIETLADYRPGYWNPLIHTDDEKMFGSIEKVMALLHDLLHSDQDLAEIRPGIALVVQTVWCAVQYERDRRAVASTVKGGRHD